jgi:hypothetical protein
MFNRSIRPISNLARQSRSMVSSNTGDELAASGHPVQDGSSSEGVPGSMHAG